MSDKPKATVYSKYEWFTPSECPDCKNISETGHVPFIITDRHVCWRKTFQQATRNFAQNMKKILFPDQDSIPDDEFY